MSPDSDSDLEPELEPDELSPRRRRRARSLPPPVDPAEPRAPRRVHRARQERIIGGVCGGLARSYALDPSFVRALTVLAAFVGGAGLVGYLVLLFLLPLEPRAWAAARPEPAPRIDVALVWAGLGLVALALGVLTWIDALSFRLFTLDRGSLWPALLIAGAVAVMVSRRRDPAAHDEIRARALSRPRQDRMLFGVASGFARYAGIDANLVRLALAVVAVWSYGIGVALYLALAALLPLDRSAG